MASSITLGYGLFSMFRKGFVANKLIMLVSTIY